jgi:hypothetical protein
MGWLAWREHRYRRRYAEKENEAAVSGRWRQNEIIRRSIRLLVNVFFLFSLKYSQEFFANCIVEFKCNGPTGFRLNCIDFPFFLKSYISICCAVAPVTYMIEKTSYNCVLYREDHTVYQYTASCMEKTIQCTGSLRWLSVGLGRVEKLFLTFMRSTLVKDIKR